MMMEDRSFRDICRALRLTPCSIDFPWWADAGDTKFIQTTRHLLPRAVCTSRQLQLNRGGGGLLNIEPVQCREQEPCS